MVQRDDSRVETLSQSRLKRSESDDRKSHYVVRDTQQKLFKHWCRALVWSYQIAPVLVCSYRGAHRSCTSGS